MDQQQVCDGDSNRSTQLGQEAWALSEAEADRAGLGPRRAGPPKAALKASLTGVFSPGLKEAPGRWEAQVPLRVRDLGRTRRRRLMQAARRRSAASLRPRCFVPASPRRS